MTALMHEDPQITDAIEKLQQKMAAVSEALESTRTPAQKRALKKQKAGQTGKRTVSASRQFIKYLVLLLFMVAISYVGAQLASLSLEQEVVIQEPVAEPQPEQPPAPARFMLKTAQYELIESELGPSLEITIFIENAGGQKGTPTMLEIDLVDSQNQSLMKWPMTLNSGPIEAGETQSFVTRLIEPPAAFANIRVSMPK